MKIATAANARTAWAAKKSLNDGLRLAFSAGSVMGFVVVGLGLLDVSLWYYFLQYWFRALPEDVYKRQPTGGFPSPRRP